MHNPPVLVAGQGGGRVHGARAGGVPGGLRHRGPGILAWTLYPSQRGYSGRTRSTRLQTRRVLYARFVRMFDAGAPREHCLLRVNSMSVLHLPDCTPPSFRGRG